MMLSESSDKTIIVDMKRVELVSSAQQVPFVC